MSKVYIEGMEMPKSCAYCRFFQVYNFGDNARCILNYKIEISEEYWKERRNKNCPLKECK